MSLPHEKRASQLMDFDPIREARILVAQKGEDEAAAGGLALLLNRARNELKDALLSELGDTYRGMPKSGLLETLKNTGFAVFSETKTVGGEHTTHNLVAASQARKLLLGASLSKDRLESLSLYGLIDDKGSDEEFDKFRSAGLCTRRPVRETEHEVIYSADDGLMIQLNRFDEAGLVFIDWPPLDEEERSWLPAYLPGGSPQWVQDFTNRPPQPA